MHLTVSLKNRPTLSHFVLIVLSLLPLYYTSYQYRTRHPNDVGKSSINAPLSSPGTSFIDDWLSTHLIQPFNPSPLTFYCNHTVWRSPRLVFNLPNANGGIGNVRGNFLDFVFFAIEAGASIILPGMAARSELELHNVWGDGGRRPFSDFFDEQWFLDVLDRTCPQLVLYRDRGEGEEEWQGVVEGTYVPRTRRMDRGVENTRQAYLEDLAAWLQERNVTELGERKKMTEVEGEEDEEGSVVVNVERRLWEVDTASLPFNLRRDFGSILRLQPTARRLAAIVVREMSERFALGIDPTAPIAARKFYGAHLRTESDAVTAGWLDGTGANFTTQTDAFLREAERHQLRTIYVASGNATELERFRGKAALRRPPLNVTSKFDLLPAAEAATLRRMSWDEQALVDYEVLQRCSVFGGVVKSSFSYNIATTRNQWLRDQGRVVDPWMVQNTEDGVSFDDGLSRLLGRDLWHEERIPRGMWP